MKKRLISTTVLSILMGIQSPALAAKMEGKFDFIGYSSYCDASGDPANLKIMADVAIHKEKKPDGTEVAGRGSTIKFIVPSTDCYKPGWSTKEISITNDDDGNGVKFGPDWQIEKITFKDLADPRTYADGSTNGVLDGFLDFMNMKSKMDLTYAGTGATSFFEVDMTARPGTTLPKPQDLKNIKKIDKKNEHKDQGKEPFSGIFISDVPLNPLPSELTLTLNTDSSLSSIKGPVIWGEETIDTKVSEARITVELNSSTGEFEITDFTFIIDSFDINGVPSGQNQISQRPGTNSRFEFDSSTGEFDAYLEELLVNDLYPESNPILVFSHVEGLIISEFEVIVNTKSDPMIVPGFPGEDPIDELGMAYIPTIATFDTLTGLLTFGDNLGNGLIPDVSIVRSLEGTYFSNIGGTETLLGASFRISPLQFLGLDETGNYIFSDSEFSIFNEDGTFASGTLTNIGIKPVTFDFSGDIILDNIPDILSSPFIDSWRSNPSIQLLSPTATSSLIAETNEFTESGESETDLINLTQKVPEPSTILSLLTIGGIALGTSTKKQG